MFSLSTTLRGGGIPTASCMRCVFATLNPQNLMGILNYKTQLKMTWTMTVHSAKDKLKNETQGIYNLKGRYKECEDRLFLEGHSDTRQYSDIYDSVLRRTQ